MLRVMEKILIGGCGITGSATAALLRKSLPAGCKISVWDKARGLGGRMCTHRSLQDERCTVDIGAQYISAEPHNQVSHRDIYDELQLQEVLRPFQGLIENNRTYPEGTKHYVAPSGIGSLAKHFIDSSGISVARSHKITSVSSCQQSRKWQVTTADGHTDTFDCVVLTFPVPQVLQLQGSIQQLIESQPDVRSKLQNVVFSSRFALGIFYDSETSVDVPWSAKYISEDDVIVFVAVDNKKRGQESKGVGPSVVAHTSVPFGLAHLESDTDNVCANIVLPRLRHLLPELPPGGRVRNHKWRYSQVYKSYEGAPGMIVLQEQPLLVCAGDSFIGSNFDNCLHSAKRTAETILKYTQKQSGL